MNTVKDPSQRFFKVAVLFSNRKIFSIPLKEIIDPISKTLMCGETGIGAMETVSNIVDRVRSKLKK